LNAPALSRFGEIDLIMLQQVKSVHTKKSQNYLVFIEVRHRKNFGYGTAIETINYAKQQKLRKTADYFILKNLHYSKNPARFDVMLIPPTNSKGSIEWIKNAF